MNKKDLVRIVRMEFDPLHVSEFETMFSEVCEKIRNFPGCTYLELLQHETDKNVFFTYSKWQEAIDLENYRNSELFKSVWQKTRTMFKENSKPMAFSLMSKMTIGPQ